METVKADEGAAEQEDIYSDINTEELQAKEASEAEADALYDDVLTGSVDSESAVKKPEFNVKSYGGKRFSVYVGNFTWWTSDNDLILMARRQGVRDIIDVKFAENKTNGQSKGYAEMVVSSEESRRRLLKLMPQCKIHGEKVECRLASRENLTEFEDLSKKRIPQRVNSKEVSGRVEGRTQSSPCPPDVRSFPVPPMFPSSNPPPLIPSFYNTPPVPPPPPPGVRPPLLPTPFPFYGPPPLYRLPSSLTHALNSQKPSLHINPAFSHPSTATPSSSNSSKIITLRSQLGDADFDELINRNRTIASSAITKAISAATSGDIRMAIETLYTATAVIQQSRVFCDKRCKMLVESLNDCLNSIETKCFPSSKRSHSRERERSRSRDRYREHSSSPERDRERKRDRSRSRDRYRERSSSSDRDRERERGRDRERRDRH